jgi:cytochrome P450
MPLPLGPALHPALQTLHWIRRPFDFLEESHAAFGDAFTLRLTVFPRPVVILSHPDAVKDVFALGPEDAQAGKANGILKPFLGEHSVLMLDGAEHLRQRKMLLPAFHGERMGAYGRSMLDLAHETIDRMPVGERFAVHAPMQGITLEVILRTVFGIADGPRFAELATILKKGLAVAAWPGLLFPVMQHDLGPLSPWGRFVRLSRRASEILRAEIHRGRAQGTAGRADALAMILDAKDEAGQPLSEDEVHDQLLTLLVAGHETTATALAWTLRWVLPDAQLVARLREEIATADGDPVRIARLELLDATVKEALRLQPVVPIVGRYIDRPMTIGGHDVPAGVMLAPAIYLVHRRPSLYPEPKRFRPERFLDFRPAPWELLPFGGGLRRCIGAAFAIYEMKMVLAALLPRVDMRLDVIDPRPVRRSITLAPAGGLPVVVTAKSSREAVRPRAA